MSPCADNASHHQQGHQYNPPFAAGHDPHPTHQAIHQIGASFCPRSSAWMLPIPSETPTDTSPTTETRLSDKMDSIVSCTQQRKSDSSRWTKDEHLNFLHGLSVHGKQWKKIADMIQTRTMTQVRTHAQKFLLKLQKAKQERSEVVLLPEEFNIALAQPRAPKAHRATLVKTQKRAIRTPSKRQYSAPARLPRPLLPRPPRSSAMSAPFPHTPFFPPRPPTSNLATSSLASLPPFAASGHAMPPPTKVLNKQACALPPATQAFHNGAYTQGSSLRRTRSVELLQSDERSSAFARAKGWAQTIGTPAPASTESPTPPGIPGPLSSGHSFNLAAAANPLTRPQAMLATARVPESQAVLDQSIPNSSQQNLEKLDPVEAQTASAAAASTPQVQSGSRAHHVYSQVFDKLTTSNAAGQWVQAGFGLPTLAPDLQAQLRTLNVSLPTGPEGVVCPFGLLRDISMQIVDAPISWAIMPSTAPNKVLTPPAAPVVRLPSEHFFLDEAEEATLASSKQGGANQQLKGSARGHYRDSDPLGDLRINLATFPSARGPSVETDTDHTYRPSWLGLLSPARQHANWSLHAGFEKRVPMGKQEMPTPSAF